MLIRSASDRADCLLARQASRAHGTAEPGTFADLERRLSDANLIGIQTERVLEAQLPEGVAILGIDEHTALVVELAADTAWVVDAVGSRYDGMACPAG